MSFTCSKCHKPAPRNVSPVLQAFSREKVYTEIDEKGFPTQVGTGHETQWEAKLCPTCSGVPIPEPASLDTTIYSSFVNGFARKHAKSCDGTVKKRKNGEDRTELCMVCADIRARFGAIPSPILTNLLTEPKAREARFSLVTLLVGDGAKGLTPSGGLHAQSARKGKRAARDFEVGYKFLKAYESRGGKLR